MLTASDYYGQISASSPVGAYILTVGYNTIGNSVANVTNLYYDISGYYSQYFKIDRKKGHLIVNNTLRGHIYSFDVTLFYTVTYTNGSVGHNYVESDVFITAIGSFIDCVCLYCYGITQFDALYLLD